MKQTRLTSSAALPGSVGGGFDGLYPSWHSWTHSFCKRKQKKKNVLHVILIAFMNLGHLDSRMNGGQFVIDLLFCKWS